MAVRQIRLYGDPILEQPAEPIQAVTEEVLRLAEDMTDTMLAKDGVGLAANQIGVLKRMITIKKESVGLGEGIQVLINPVITYFEGAEVDEEGCLSFPDLYLQVERPTYLEVEAQELVEGRLRPIRIRARGFYARVLAHEIDHINGILFIQRIPEHVARLELARWRKAMREKAHQHPVDQPQTSPIQQ